MAIRDKPSYEELKRRLATAEAALDALRSGQVDTIVGDRENLVVRLAEAEAREAHVKQVLHAIRKVNQLIVAEDDPQRLIEQACTTLTETLGYHSAWVALAEPGAQAAPGDWGSIKIASSGFGNSAARFHDQLMRGEFPTCMRQALEQEEAVVIQKPETDCPDCPVLPDYGGRAAICRRLHCGGKTYGALAVSVPEAYVHGEEEQKLFAELADDLAFGLHKIESAREHRTTTARLQGVLDHSPLLISEFSPEGRYQLVNPAIADLFNCSAAELTGKTFGDLLPAATVELFKERIQRVMDTGAPLTVEDTLETKGGQLNYITTLFPLFDEAGNVRAIGSIAHDITERTHAERALRANENYLRTILQTTVDGFWVIDNRGRFIDVNEAYCTISGYAREELIGLTIADIEAAEAPEDTAARIERIIATGSELFETRHRRKDGTVFPVEVSTTYIEEGGGRFICFCRDLTERAQAEKALRDSEEKFRGLVEHAQAGIWSIDAQANTTYVNPRMAEILGYTADEMLGQHLFAFMDETARQHAIENLDRRRQGVAEAHDFRFCHKSGRLVLASLWTTPVLDAEGAFTGAIAVVIDVTERKRSEERIALLGQMLDEAPAAITIHDTTGRFVYANRKTFALHGYEEDEFLDVNLHDLDVPESRALLEERFRQIEQTGEASFEVAHYRKDGSIFPLQVLAKLITWDVKPAILSIAADITERKRAEDELARTQSELQAIYDHTPVMICLLDEDRRVRYANPAFAAFSGANTQNVEASTACGVFGCVNALKDARGCGFSDECSECTLLAAMTDTLRTGCVHKNVERCLVLERDGHRQAVWLSASTALIRQGADASLLLCLEDITDRKEAEEALRKSEAQKNLILNSTSEMIAYYDTDLRVVWANHASCESVGKGSQALVGQHCYQIWHGRDELCEGCPVIKARDTGMSQAGEMQTPDGRCWRVRGYPIFDDKGEVIALVEFGQEITAEKRAAAERAAFEEQQRHAQRIESIGRLAGGVAHDFNNMLGVILGHTEIAQEEIDTSHAVYAELEEIRKAAERSANLTRQLLAFARQQTIAPKVLDLNETVAGLLTMLRRLIGEDINLAWHPAHGVWSVHMDPTQIDQILANLCVNARDAIKGVGKVTIETSNVRLDERYCAEHPPAVPGDYVRLVVSDTGIGMDEETLASVFDPFFTTKPQGEGTGLGLATVYGIVRQNGGLISVSSEQGKGTSFTIHLPRFTGGETVSDRHETPESAQGGSETVLLVEDEAMVLALAKRLLERLGYRVLASNQPSEALALAQEHGNAIHLLITDVVMPGMNGHDLATRLQSRFPGLRVLYTSGYTADVIAHHGVLDEGVEFIQKPYGIQDFAAKIREILDK